MGKEVAEIQARARYSPSYWLVACRTPRAAELGCSEFSSRSASRLEADALSPGRQLLFFGRTCSDGAVEGGDV